MTYRTENILQLCVGDVIVLQGSIGEFVTDVGYKGGIRAYLEANKLLGKPCILREYLKSPKGEVSVYRYSEGLVEVENHWHDTIDKYERDHWIASAKPSQETAPQAYDSKGNAAHYQKFIDDYQWIEVMGRLPKCRDLKNGIFFGTLEILARKYLDRLGKKDDPIKELDKAIWYLQYLRKCMATNTVADPREDL